jgi:ADP-heptose:LPS heptosyltransferase
MEKPPVKFLIIRFSSIGDIVLTTPVVRCLKKQVEGAEIHYLTKIQYAPILQSNPYIKKVFTLKDSLSEVIDELKQEKYHYIIDLHKNIRTKIIRSQLKTLAFGFNKLNTPKWLMVNFKINRLPEKHIVDRYFDAVKLFDVKNDQKGLDYFIDSHNPIDKKVSLAQPFSGGYIGFAIGAKHNTKRLPTEKIISICKMLQLPVVLLGDENDSDIGKKIKKALGKNIHNGCGKYTLAQSAMIIKDADAIIAHDTGLMHIAAAFEKKIISIWGNTIPAFGMYPYMPHPSSKIIEVKNLKCRPCSKLGFDKCPKNHFRCMQDINEKDVIKAVKSSTN